MTKYTAGRELDALIAEKVLGCNVRRGAGTLFYCGCGETGNYPHAIDDRDGQLFGILAHYSTDNAAAVQVLEYFCQNGRAVIVVFSPIGYGVRNTNNEGMVLFGWDDNNIIYADALTFPLAVCQFALKAIESK